VREAVKIVDPILKLLYFTVAFVVITIVIWLRRSLRESIRPMRLPGNVPQLKVEGED
jgi:hypothetical protein